MTRQTWITLACVELAYQAIVTCELAVTIRLVAILVPEHFKGHIDFFVTRLLPNVASHLKWNGRLEMASPHLLNISINVFASDALDWVPWLRCRAVSRQLRDDALGPNQNQNAKIYLDKRHWYRLADCASQTISAKPWIAQDPRCCYQYCRNEFGGRTGLWFPRRVGRHLPDEDARLLEGLWWKNGTPSRAVYMKFRTQQRVQDWIQSAWLRHGVRRIFVVCSEACWEKVDAALRIMEVRTSSIGHERDFRIILAVDHVRLSVDSVLIENNRNQFGTQLEPSWNQLESSWSVPIRSWNIPTPSWEFQHLEQTPAFQPHGTYF